MGPLQNEAGKLATEDEENAEILKGFFASVFTTTISMKESLIQETREKFWREEEFLLVEEDWVRNHLGKFDIHISMDPDGMRKKNQGRWWTSWLIIFERSWQSGEVPDDWKKANTIKQVPSQSSTRARKIQETTGKSASHQFLGK